MRARSASGRVFCLFAVGLMAGAAAGSGRAAGIRDLDDGWLLGPGACAALLGAPDTGPPAWLSVGQSRLYGQADLPLSALRAGLRCPFLPGEPNVELAWQSLGKTILREELLLLSIVWGGDKSVGVTVRSTRLRFPSAGAEGSGDPRRLWLSLMLQRRWQPAAATDLRARLYLDLFERPTAAAPPGRRPLARVEARRGGLGLAMATDARPQSGPTVGLEVWVAGGAAAIGVRSEPAVGAIGPVLSWRHAGFICRTSHLTHPTLGVTHRFQAGFGWTGGLPW